MSKININNSIEEVRALLSKEKNISSALRASIEVILTLITLFMAKRGLNSKIVVFLHLKNQTEKKRVKLRERK